MKLFPKKQLDIETFIADSLMGLQLVTEEHRSTWNLGQERAWKVDEGRGRLTLQFADGKQATAAAQIVGSYHLTSGHFTWGWEHPAVPAPMQKHAVKVKAFGSKYRHPELITQTVQCSEKRAWEYTALAMLLAEASGAYRVQGAGDTFVYMTFGPVQLG